MVDYYFPWETRVIRSVQVAAVQCASSEKFDLRGWMDMMFRTYLENQQIS